METMTIYHITDMTSPQYRLEDILSQINISYAKLDNFKPIVSNRSVIVLECNNRMDIYKFFEYLEDNHLNFPVLLITDLTDGETLLSFKKLGYSDVFYAGTPHSFLRMRIENLRENYSEYTLKNNVLHQAVDTKNFTKKEKEIFNLVSTSPRYEISKTTVLERLWGHRETYTNTLDVHLYNIRRKLRDFGVTIECNNSGNIAIKFFTPLRKQISPLGV
jgi:DNA-binding response OmpR family regulator